MHRRRRRSTPRRAESPASRARTRRASTTERRSADRDGAGAERPRHRGRHRRARRRDGQPQRGRRSLRRGDRRAVGPARRGAREPARAAVVHDAGKIGVPDAVLLKPGPLTPAERDVMERHSVLGYRIALAAGLPEREASGCCTTTSTSMAAAIRIGLRGEEIPLASRILLVADAFDAMTAARPYRPARAAARRWPSCAAARERSSTPARSRRWRRARPTRRASRPALAAAVADTPGWRLSGRCADEASLLATPVAAAGRNGGVRRRRRRLDARRRGAGAHRASPAAAFAIDARRRSARSSTPDADLGGRRTDPCARVREARTTARRRERSRAASRRQAHRHGTPKRDARRHDGGRPATQTPTATPKPTPDRNADAHAEAEADRDADAHAQRAGAGVGRRRPRPSSARSRSPCRPAATRPRSTTAGRSRWPRRARAARSTGTVHADVLFQGSPVRLMDKARFDAGGYRHHVTWPAESRGYPLTVQVDVTAGGQRQVFLYDLQVSDAPAPAPAG